MAPGEINRLILDKLRLQNDVALRNLEDLIGELIDEIGRLEELGLRNKFDSM